MNTYLSDDNLFDTERAAGENVIEVCYNGCCCGKAEKGNSPVRKDAYERFYAASSLAGKMELRFLPCLDFCREANTVRVRKNGKDFFFRKINEEDDIAEIFRFAATGQMSERLTRKQIGE